MTAVKLSPALDPQAGAAALDEDLPRVLKACDAKAIEELGWSRPNRLTLLVPMSGFIGEQKDDFTLRLGFEAYRKWPPSAQFVNPATLSYENPKDQCFVPRLTSSECHTHTAYARPGGGTLQLICCSATLEFYQVGHEVKAEHLWGEKDTFLLTIMAIRKAMGSEHV